MGEVSSASEQQLGLPGITLHDQNSQAECMTGDISRPGHASPPEHAGHHQGVNTHQPTHQHAHPTASQHLRRLNTGTATPAPRQRCCRRKQPSKRATSAGARVPSFACAEHNVEEHAVVGSSLMRNPAKQAAVGAGAPDPGCPQHPQHMVTK